MRRSALLLACAATTYACSCAFLGNLHEAFCLSDYVTHAKVASKSYSDDGTSINYIVEHMAVYRKPEDMFQLPMTITSPSELPACGVELDVEEEYLLGGKILNDGSLLITSCGLMRKWDEFSRESKKALRTYTCKEEGPDDA
ncbi:unnamed protein product [Cylicocyclus nassatus]|uniref:NTR domain-containing protein n=1 Tax=Cylicocyclus nassatus TaxID=53992 RepID=A0AA36H8T4_CYLNA|nr:unnamed protein product [Cylicocyclus nassatus]